MIYVSGTQKVINNLMMQRFKMLKDLGEAVEKTCVDVKNHAKSGHAGNQAHMSKRYRNRTTNLTRSIFSELTKVDWNSVEGIVAAGAEYAPYVEGVKAGTEETAQKVEIGTAEKGAYPFMYPAIVANKKNFEDRIKRALRR